MKEKKNNWWRWPECPAGCCELNQRSLTQTNVLPRHYPNNLWAISILYLSRLVYLHFTCCAGSSASSWLAGQPSVLPYIHAGYPLITYYWSVPLILDHSYVVGKSTNLKVAERKVSGFKGSKVFLSAIFEFVKFLTRYEWSNIRRLVQ
jgi:hypothetical protein